MTTDATFAATETSRVFGRQAIEAYERIVQSTVDFERAAADAAPADWLKTAIGAHAAFVSDVNAAYVGALRSIMS
jgi:hypothetical protein